MKGDTTHSLLIRKKASHLDMILSPINHFPNFLSVFFFTVEKSFFFSIFYINAAVVNSEKKFSCKKNLPDIFRLITLARSSTEKTSLKSIEELHQF